MGNWNPKFKKGDLVTFYKGKTIREEEEKINISDIIWEVICVGNRPSTLGMYALKIYLNPSKTYIYLRDNWLIGKEIDLIKWKAKKTFGTTKED